MPNIIMLISRLDSYLSDNEFSKAEELLSDSYNEAKAAGSSSELLTILSEQMGLYRKLGKAEQGVAASREGAELVESTPLRKTVSGATILINAATTLKAFGLADEALPLMKRRLRFMMSVSRLMMSSLQGCIIIMLFALWT